LVLTKIDQKWNFKKLNHKNSTNINQMKHNKNQNAWFFGSDLNPDVIQLFKSNDLNQTTLTPLVVNGGAGC